MIMNGNITRRALMKGGLVAGALVPVAGLFINNAAYGGDSPALDPSEPTAKALNYVTKSAKADQNCANCSQFKGKAGDAMGPCAIFSGKSVASAGWCSGWVKKAAV
jgi:High potential iron-sulfur protein